MKASAPIRPWPSLDLRRVGPFQGLLLQPHGFEGFTSSAPGGRRHRLIASRGGLTGANGGGRRTTRTSTGTRRRTRSRGRRCASSMPARTLTWSMQDDGIPWAAGGPSSMRSHAGEAPRVVPRLVDAGDLVGDRRRPARLAGAGRAVRGGAGGARAPRRHGRRGVAIAIGVPPLAVLALVSSGASRSASRCCWPRSPCCSSPMRRAPGWWGAACCAPARRRRWAALLAGWGILRVLALIPVVGALVGLAATVVGLGALAMALWRAGRPGARGEARGAGSGSSSRAG